MTLWFVLALMTVAAIFAVLWPLSRQAPARAGNQSRSRARRMPLNCQRAAAGKKFR